MDRRQILKYTAMLTGTALCAPLTTAMLSGCVEQVTSPNTAASVGGQQFFNAQDFQLLSQIMDAILPKTDSPSATEVGVHQVMDQMFAVVFDSAYQQKFSQQFAKLSQALQAQGFANLPAKQQAQVLKAIETGDRSTDVFGAYMDIKQQTVAYYLTSEQIGENFLNYLPIPGEYKPCVSLQELGGKAWSI